MDSHYFQGMATLGALRYSLTCIFFYCMYVLTHVRVNFEVNDLLNREFEHTVTGLNICDPPRENQQKGDDMACDDTLNKRKFL